MKIIKVIKSNGKNNGYCKLCRKYFKKAEHYLMFETPKVNKVVVQKICVPCLLELIAEKIGWTKLSALIFKKTAENI